MDIVVNKQTTGVIRPFESQFGLLENFVDSVCIGFGLWLAGMIMNRPWTDRYTVFAILGSIVFYFIARLFGIYQKPRGTPVQQYFLPILYSWIGVTFVILLFGYATKTTQEYSRLVLGAWFFLTPISLLLWRINVDVVLRYLRNAGYNTRTAAIVGAVQNGNRLAQSITESPWLGLKLVGIFDERVPEEGRINLPLTAPICGNTEELVKLVINKHIDIVYIALPLQAEERIQSLLDRLANTTASVYLVPGSFAYRFTQGHWTNIGSVPVVSIHETPFLGLGGASKRLEDILLASIALVVASLPMLVIALGIKLSSLGPILFKQRRYGLDGKEFKVWKFRTMNVLEDGSRVVQAKKHDHRVYPFGGFLRRSSLDELPQFFNVLFGQMSMVGPRPHAVAHNEQYRESVRGYMLRHKVKPGVTGWAQINGFRGEIHSPDKMAQRVEHDMHYINNWSLLFDFWILIKTPVALMKDSNAY